MSSTTEKKRLAASIDSHLKEIGKSLDGCVGELERAIEIIRDVKSSEKTLWVLGNGGSMAIAQHFAQDMMKMRGVRAQAVNCPSIITAYSNDIRFEECFMMPLEILREDGDAVMIFSCSGKSRNYESIVAKQWKPLISVVGTDGGFLKDKADACVHVKNNSYQVCETAFSVVADMINIGMED